MSQVRTPIKSGGGRKRPSPELLQQQSSTPSTPRNEQTSPRTSWSKRRRRHTPLKRSTLQPPLLFPTRRKASSVSSSSDEEPPHATPPRLADFESPIEETCCTPRNSTVASTPDEVVPKAPARRVRRNWVNLMLNNDAEALEQALATDDDDSVGSEVCAEWLNWDVHTHEVIGSRRIWVQPILLAARWCSPKIVSILIQHGAPLTARTNDGQNLLSVLCSQPPVSLKFFHAVRPFQAPADFSLDMMALARSTLCGKRDPKICEQFIIFRRKEAAMVARLLVLHGVSPTETDDTGNSAEDYASVFGHTLIAETFNRVRKHPNTLGARQQQNLLSHCRTPVRPATPADFTSPGIAFSAASASLPTGYGLTSTTKVAKKRSRRQKQHEEIVPPPPSLGTMMVL